MVWMFPYPKAGAPGSGPRYMSSRQRMLQNPR